MITASRGKGPTSPQSSWGRTFTTSTPNIQNTDQPALLYNAVGNPNLKPERTTESEAGFEAHFFNNRASIDFTGYYKKTRDALISATVAPSAGAATNRWSSSN